MPCMCTRLPSSMETPRLVKPAKSHFWRVYTARHEQQRTDAERYSMVFSGRRSNRSPSPSSQSNDGGMEDNDNEDEDVDAKWINSGDASYDAGHQSNTIDLTGDDEDENEEGRIMSEMDDIIESFTDDEIEDERPQQKLKIQEKEFGWGRPMTKAQEQLLEEEMWRLCNEAEEKLEKEKRHEEKRKASFVEVPDSQEGSGPSNATGSLQPSQDPAPPCGQGSPKQTRTLLDRPTAQDAQEDATYSPSQPQATAIPSIETHTIFSSWVHYSYTIPNPHERMNRLDYFLLHHNCPDREQEATLRRMIYNHERSRSDFKSFIPYIQPPQSEREKATRYNLRSGKPIASILQFKHVPTLVSEVQEEKPAGKFNKCSKCQRFVGKASTGGQRQCIHCKLKSGQPSPDGGKVTERYKTWGGIPYKYPGQDKEEATLRREKAFNEVSAAWGERIRNSLERQRKKERRRDKGHVIKLLREWKRPDNQSGINGP